MSDNPDTGRADWRYPYGRADRYNMQHTHLFASDVEATIAFFRDWFDAKVAWDGDYAGARNIFLKIGIGAIHLYEQPPRDLGRNVVHHLGMQIVGLAELHGRMSVAGLSVGVLRLSKGGGGYFMLQAPDNVLIELFEPDADGDAAALSYFGFEPAD